MSKLRNGNLGNPGTPGTHVQTQRNRLFDMEPFARTGSNAFNEVADDQRLKFALKRAVSKTDAPQYLIDSIREKIREI